MTPYEWLQQVCDAADRVVGRTWVGHFDRPAASGAGTARDVLDRMFRSVSAWTAALGGDVTEAGVPFTYGWVPLSEFTASTSMLREMAGRVARRDPDDDRLCAAAKDVLVLTVDLADTIGTTYGPTGDERSVFADATHR